MTTYDPHPLADIFPMMDGPDLAKLADDIRTTGLRDAITLFEGMVLDGRNRQAACERAGVEPRYEPFTGPDPLGFVVSHNLHRRHLATGQRAIVAAKLANMSHGGDRGGNQHEMWQAANLPLATDEPTDPPPPPPAVTQAQAATLLNVSPRAVRDGKTVIEEGVAELVEMAQAGDVSVSAAATVARELPPDEQERVASGGAKAVKAKAAELRGKPAATADPATETRGDELARLLTRVATQMTKWLNTDEPSAVLFREYAGSLQKGGVIQPPHTLVSHEHVERAAGKKGMCLFTGLRPLRHLVGKCNERATKPLSYTQLRKWWQTEVGGPAGPSEGGGE